MLHQGPHHSCPADADLAGLENLISVLPEQVSGVLSGALCYLAGPITFSKDIKQEKSWQRLVESVLTKLGIKVLTPYKPVFVNFDKIEDDNCAISGILRSQRRFDELSRLMKAVRRKDLGCIDVSTFVIVKIDPSVHLCGTYNELFVALHERKPVFIFCPDKSTLPDWIFGCLPHEWIYDGDYALTNIVSRIIDIHSTGEGIDSKYWRILNPKLFACL